MMNKGKENIMKKYLNLMSRPTKWKCLDIILMTLIGSGSAASALKAKVLFEVVSKEQDPVSSLVPIKMAESRM